MAYVDAKQAELGTELKVTLRGVVVCGWVFEWWRIGNLTPVTTSLSHTHTQYMSAFKMGGVRRLLSVAKP
jgi:hypothetical protein